MVAQYVNMPKMTEFKSCAVPAKEMDLEDHSLTLPIIFFTNDLHSTLLSLLNVIGIPRYFKGKDPSENFVICMQ